MTAGDFNPRPSAPFPPQLVEWRDGEWLINARDYGGILGVELARKHLDELTKAVEWAERANRLGIHP